MPIFEKALIDLGYTDLDAETLPSGRTYSDPEGNKYPSITTVLSVLGKEDLLAWRARVGEEEANRIGRFAAARGTAVHSIVEDYLDNKPTDKYPFHIKNSLKNLKPILDERLGKTYAAECALYSKFLGIAGRVDRVADFDGVPSIVDFKTSRRPKKKEWIHKYFMQESGYAVMWEERTGMPIVNLVTIMDVDGDAPIVFKEHRDNWIGPLRDTIELYHREQRTRPL